MKRARGYPAVLIAGPAMALVTATASGATPVLPSSGTTAPPASEAQHQTGDYYLGMNGLANRGPDDGPQVPIHTWEEYQRTQ